MILYKRDWFTHPATMHVTTKNESFIKMHHVLKRMGVENNTFFLALYNKDLADIDPFDVAHLSQDQIAAIVYECKINPWYFFREILRIPASGVDPVPFRLNRASLFILWSFFNSVCLFDVQPRQTGKTIVVVSLVDYCVHVFYTNVNIGLYTHQSKLISDNVDLLKQIRDCHPSYLIKRSVKDTENKGNIRYDALNNGYMPTVAQHTQSGAFGVGRGATRLWWHIDEGPFCPNIQISYPVLMNSTNAARQSALGAKIPFANILTTTAGRADTEAGSYVYDIMMSSCRFNESFYDLPHKGALQAILKNTSTNNILYGEFSYLQLGFDDAWKEEVVITNNLKPDDVERDILNKWTFGTATPAVDPELLKRLDTSKDDPVKTDFYEGYAFRWYEDPLEAFKSKNRYFALGLDTSDNIGHDFTTLHLLSMEDLSTVMTARCNDADLLKLAVYIAQFLMSHPTVTLVPERKSTAAMMISIISRELHNKSINPFTRIYNKVYQNREEAAYASIDTTSTAAFEGTTKKYLGYATTSSGENSRDSLYKLTLNRVLQLNCDRIKDSALISEIKQLSLKNGRIDHAVQGHDDTVISFLLASWFTLYGKNHRLYGIPEHTALSKVTETGAVIDVTIKQRHRELCKRLEQIAVTLKAVSSPVVKSSFLREQKNLQEELAACKLSNNTLQSFNAFVEETAPRGMSEENFLQMIKPEMLYENPLMPYVGFTPKDKVTRHTSAEDILNPLVGIF